MVATLATTPGPLNSKSRLKPSLAVIARYSRFVGLMRLLLPLVALLLVVVVIAWPDLYRDSGGFRITFSSMQSSDEGLTMANARYVGRDAKGQPFVVTADTATQDKMDQAQVLLDGLQADLTLADGTWITLSANTGVYSQDEELLDLFGEINIFSDRGYEFHAHTATVDLAAGVVISDNPVDGQGPFGLLKAQGMRIEDKGERMIFNNGVKVTIYPGQKQ
jgi:lipopolysaccharide export system protein LptC